MDIQQKSPPSSTWVQTLLEAISKNFAHNKMQCDSYFEEGEHISKAMFFHIIEQKFGEDNAISEFYKLWPNIPHGTVMAKADKVLSEKRYLVKRELIKNYFKYKNHEFNS